MNNTPKFRLKLNLFDGIILVLGLIVAAALLYFTFASSNTASANAKEVTYTIRFTNATPAISDQFQAGDQLEDAVKNLALGTVVSATVAPSPTYVFNESTLSYVLHPSPDYVDVEIVVKGTATLTPAEITLASGFVLNGGDTIFVRGPGYLGSGIVLHIDREVLA